MWLFIFGIYILFRLSETYLFPVVCGYIHKRFFARETPLRFTQQPVPVRTSVSEPTIEHHELPMILRQGISSEQFSQLTNLDKAKHITHSVIDVTFAVLTPLLSSFLEDERKEPSGVQIEEVQEEKTE